jgi:hypothetical protein
MRHSRWALFLVLALAMGWIGGLAALGAAAPQSDQSSEAADSWSPVGGTLAFAPLAVGSGSRSGALKTLVAIPSPSPQLAFLAVLPAALLPEGRDSGPSSALLCMPLRC